MKCIFIIFIIEFSSIFSTTAQIPLNGVITVQNSKFSTGNIEYVPNAQITSPKATPTTSHNRGQFTLNFIGLQSGDDVKISITPYDKYINYEVVNIWDLTQILNRKSTVEIYICKQGELESRKAELVGINLKKRELAYKKKEEKITKKLKQLQNTISQNSVQINLLKDSLFILKKELESQKQGIENAADKYTRTNLDFCDEDYIKAFEYFKKGELDSSLMYIPKYKESEALFEAIAYQMIQNEELRASIYRAKGDHENAKTSYMFAVRLSGLKDNYSIERFLTLLEYAEYLYQLNEFSIAEKIVEEVVWLKVNEIYKIKAYNLLGQIQEKNHISNAYENYERAIKIYERVKVEDESAAISYTLLANYNKENGKSQRAENNYKKALNIYIKMRKNNTPDNKNHLNLLIQMATFYTEARKLSLVKQCNERIEILTNVVNISLENMAHVNEHMGYLFLRNKEYEKALEKYESAYDGYVKINKTMPIIYQDDLIRAAFMSGVVCNYKKEHKKSIHYCELALKEIGDNSNITEFKKLKAYSLALQSNNYKKIKDSKKANDYLIETKKLAKEVNDPNLNKFVRYIELEKMHNTINFFMDWVLPYIGMFPYLYFIQTLLPY